MKTIIAEIGLSGHRVNYLINIVNLLDELNLPTNLILVDIDDHASEFQLFKDKAGISESAITLLKTPSGKSSDIFLLEYIETNFQYCRVFFPSFDRFWRHLVRARGNNRYSGIVMNISNGTFQSKGRTLKRRFINKQKLHVFRKALQQPHIESAYILDAYCLALGHFKEFSKVKGIGDITEIETPEPKPHVASTNKNSILAFGGLAERKGILPLLEAIRDETWPETLTVTFAGKPTPGIAEAFSEDAVTNDLRRKGITLNLGYIDRPDLNELIASHDWIWCGYKGHFNPSGVFNEAAVFRKPVIACENGAIGWFTKTFRLGVTLPTVSAPDIIKTLTSEEFQNFNVQSAEFDRYREQHGREAGLNALREYFTST